MARKRTIEISRKQHKFISRKFNIRLRGEVKFLTGGKVFTLFMMDKAVARELCYVTADLVKIQSRRYSPDERRYIVFLG